MHPFYTEDDDPALRERAKALVRLQHAVQDVNAKRGRRGSRRVRGKRLKPVLPVEEFAQGPLTGAEMAVRTGYAYSTDAGPRRPARGRAAFWKVIGPVPLCEGGQRWRARLYHEAILRAIESDDWLAWPRSEREQLRQLELRWRSRAAGLDIRFETVGNKIGSLTPSEREAVRRAKREQVGMP